MHTCMFNRWWWWWPWEKWSQSSFRGQMQRWMDSYNKMPGYKKTRLLRYKLADWYLQSFFFYWLYIDLTLTNWEFCILEKTGLTRLIYIRKWLCIFVQISLRFNMVKEKHCLWSFSLDFYCLFCITDYYRPEWIFC